jgi:hypothetical protein
MILDNELGVDFLRPVTKKKTSGEAKIRQSTIPEVVF